MIFSFKNFPTRISHIELQKLLKKFSVIGPVKDIVRPKNSCKENGASTLLEVDLVADNAKLYFGKLAHSLGVSKNMFQNFFFGIQI